MRWIAMKLKVGKVPSLNCKSVLKNGCRCRRGLKGGRCSDHFREETVLNNLYQELSRVEVDLVILANIEAFATMK